MSPLWRRAATAGGAAPGSPGSASPGRTSVANYVNGLLSRSDSDPFKASDIRAIGHVLRNYKRRLDRYRYALMIGLPAAAVAGAVLYGALLHRQPTTDEITYRKPVYNQAGNIEREDPIPATAALDELYDDSSAKSTELSSFATNMTARFNEFQKMIDAGTAEIKDLAGSAESRAKNHADELFYQDPKTKQIPAFRPPIDELGGKIEATSTALGQVEKSVARIEGKVSIMSQGGPGGYTGEPAPSGASGPAAERPQYPSEGGGIPVYRPKK